MFEALLSSLSQLRPFAWRTALALLVVASFLVMAPQSALEATGLLELARDNAATISLLGLLCLGVISVELFELSKGKAMDWLEKRKYRQNREKFLKGLSGDEKIALRRFIDEGKSTIHFSLSQGVASALESKGLISRSSNLGLPGTSDVFPYMIQPVVLNLLRNQPDLLDL